VGCLVVLVIALIMKRLTWSKVRRIMLESARLTVMIMVILMSVKFFVHFLTHSGLILGFAELAMEIENPLLVIAAIIAITFFMGMFIGGPKMYLTAPIFVPIIVALGYDPFWFGVIMIKMIELGFISPPVCNAVFITQGIIRDVSSGQAIKSVVPFIACDLITVAIIVFFPAIVTWLPNMMYQG